MGNRVSTSSGESATTVDSATWKSVSVQLCKRSGEDLVTVEMLRSDKWINQTDAKVGGQVNLDLEEMGVSGWATITDIQPCPKLEDGPGRVVLATIASTATNVIELVLTGHGVRGPPLRPTATHPIFSETAQKWVRAGELNVGDRVRTDGGAAEIAEIRRFSGAHRVFNLRTQ